MIDDPTLAPWSLFGRRNAVVPGRAPVDPVSALFADEHRHRYGRAAADRQVSIASPSRTEVRRTLNLLSELAAACHLGGMFHPTEARYHRVPAEDRYPPRRENRYYGHLRAARRGPAGGCRGAGGDVAAGAAGRRGPGDRRPDPRRGPGTDPLGDLGRARERRVRRCRRRAQAPAADRSRRLGLRAGRHRCRVDRCRAVGSGHGQPGRGLVDADGPARWRRGGRTALPRGWCASGAPLARSWSTGRGGDS